MDNAQVALIASALGLVVTTHLGVRSYLARRAEEEPDDEMEGSDYYNPYDLSAMPLHSQEDQRNAALIQRLSPLAQLVKPSNQVELNELRQQLGYAGFRRPESFELFNAVRAGVLLFGILPFGSNSPLSTNIVQTEH